MLERQLMCHVKMATGVPKRLLLHDAKSTNTLSCQRDLYCIILKQLLTCHAEKVTGVLC